MIKAKKIISFLNSKYPESKMEKWDKAGLQYGDKDQVVKKIFVTLDLTPKTFEKAIDYQADMIITHHPFLWEDDFQDDIAKAPYKEILDKRLKNTNMVVYSTHTNYDQASDGTSFQVAKRLGLKSKASKKIKYAQIISEKLTISKIEKMLLNNLGVSVTISNNKLNNKTFKKIAIIAGSGSIEDIVELHKEDVELIITSDVKWSDWIAIDELGLTVLEVTHGIETVFSEHISNLLNEKIKDIESKFEHVAEIIEL